MGSGGFLTIEECMDEARRAMVLVGRSSIFTSRKPLAAEVVSAGAGTGALPWHNSAVSEHCWVFFDLSRLWDV